MRRVQRSGASVRVKLHRTHLATDTTLEIHSDASAAGKNERRAARSRVLSLHQRQTLRRLARIGLYAAASSRIDAVSTI